MPVSHRVKKEGSEHNQTDTQSMRSASEAECLRQAAEVLRHTRAGAYDGALKDRPIKEGGGGGPNRL